MLSNGNNYNCEGSGDLIAYIYDEIDPNGRRSFETHLAGCKTCTVEFAGVSDARSSVSEWRSEWFAGLETPVFEIPYERQADAAETAGFFSGLRALLSTGGMRLATAAVLITFAAGGLWLTLSPEEEMPRASSVAKPEPEEKSIIAIPNEQAAEVTALPEAAIVPPAFENAGTERKAVSISENSRVRNVRASAPKPRVQVQRSSTTAVRQTSKPRLGSFEDIEDNSLRLSDLLDDIGG